MKVLWILNSPLPEAVSALTGRPEVSHATGSWVCALAEALSQEKDLQLFTAAPSSLVSRCVECTGASATHYILPQDQHPWRAIYERVKPDITHIHGTEYGFFYDFVKVCGNKHVVVSLQGLVSEIRKWYYGSIPETVIRRYTSLRDIARCDTLMRQRRDITLRGEGEIRLLRSVNHVIGRTSWDRSVSLDINPHLSYHSCNEILRTPFYSGKWSYDGCVPHRLFLTQGYYPLKGVHILIEALPSVLDNYPDTQVRIAGINPLRGDGIKDILLRNGYGRYLISIIRKNGVSDAIRFIGEATAEGIKQELLQANVFLSTSVIENSPNSLCEAQMLGVPCIASAVGGTPDLIPDVSCGALYPFNDAHSLADNIIALLKSSPSFDNSRMREVASTRHDRSQTIQRILDIYDQVAD